MTKEKCLIRLNNDRNMFAWKDQIENEEQEYYPIVTCFHGTNEFFVIMNE